MRLEPVFLLAPKPAGPSIPTRRAFLIGGGALVLGSAVAGACGYGLGYAAGRRAEATDASGGAGGPGGAGGAGEIELEPSGDADLDELRRLAVKAPIEELVEKVHMFLGYRAQSYRDDRILWRGVERLAIEVIKNPNREVDSPIISSILSAIEAPDSPKDPDLGHLVERLRQRRSEVRRK